ncbi:MAG: YidC/Oxa1 family membrane protein insertase [Clostridia bacterium]|nr:YidC/Oxa1 family membrane protein insertase [Clostridia bacterium]
MEISNILSSLVYYAFKAPVVTGLTQWVTWFITLFSSVGVGVIVFTIVLKLITFPLDYASRASMRKNSLKMEEMRPELEKLQKQYANDKTMYQQKMMAVYKKNGYSAFGSCLPTIVTLVFFIIVLTSFNDYSTYQNVKYLYNMNIAFNNVIDYGIEDVDGYITRDAEGKPIIDDIKIYNEKTGDTFAVTVDGVTLNAVYTPNTVTYTTSNGYISITKSYTVDGENVTFTFDNSGRNLLIDKIDRQDLKTSDGKTFSEYVLSDTEGKTTEELASSFILDIQQTAAANKYREEEESFLWIQNIWQTDSAMAHPVYSDYKSFNAKYNLSGYTSDEQQYTNLTAKLGAEKNKPNGYFILIALTIGTSFLMQWISTKSNKAQMELQNVDGTGMQTQKMMMWMMPIMMAFFAFMYTAAFSLYIIMSSLTSAATTLLINKIVDIQIKRENKKKENEKSVGTSYNKNYSKKRR